MFCPRCKDMPEDLRLDVWKCDCGEVSCLHVETCPICLVTREPLPGFATELRMHPGQLKEQIFNYATFQMAAISIGLSLQLAETIGVEREKASKTVFDEMNRVLGLNTQHILKQVYGDLPVSESDRVLARKYVKEFIESAKLIADKLKRPPPDAGTYSDA